jgi:hypothetical protein
MPKTHKEFYMKKGLCTLAVFFGVLFTAVSPRAEAQNASDFQTTVANGQVTITGYTGSVNDVRIPDRINGLPVMAIGEEAFWNTRLTSVIIGDSVMLIGNAAFANTRLTSVIIGDSVMLIGNAAFASTRLTSVTIPNSVTSIGAGAFDAGVEIIRQ